MSDMRVYSGNLTPVALDGKTHEEYFRSLFKDSEILNDYYDSWSEKVEEGLGRKFIVIKGELHEIEAVEQDPCYLCVVTAKEGGTYDFVAIYYDGGTHLREVLEDAFEGNED